MNKWIFNGTLGADPDYHQTDGDKKARTRLRIAVTEYYGGENHTTWVNTTIFGPRADFVGKYLKKGHKVLVEGKPGASAYAKNGEPTASLECIAMDIESLTSRAEAEAMATKPRGEAKGNYNAPLQPAPADEDEDLPF